VQHRREDELDKKRAGKTPHTVRAESEIIPNQKGK